jgi:hypothetical protein
VVLRNSAGVAHLRVLSLSVREFPTALKPTAPGCLGSPFRAALRPESNSSFAKRPSGQHIVVV